MKTNRNCKSIISSFLLQVAHNNTRKMTYNYAFIASQINDYVQVFDNVLFFFAQFIYL